MDLCFFLNKNNNNRKRRKQTFNAQTAKVAVCVLLHAWEGKRVFLCEEPSASISTE